MSLRVLAIVAVLACAAPAGAQSVRVEFNAGMVSVSAQNAPLRNILAEWARLGGATIVNGDRLAGPPLTLELTNVTERQALDTLLRNAAGYVLAPRRAGTAGASAFDRILILPTSVGPRNAPAPAAAAPGLAGPRPLQLPRPPVVVQQPESEEPAPDVPEAAEPAATPTPVRATPFGAPRPLIPPTPPVQPGDAAAGDAPAAEEPAPAETQPNAANPFGMPAGSSSTPGVVTPAPRPAPAQQGR